MTRTERASLRVSVAVLGAAVLVVGTIRVEVLLGFLWATIAVAAAFVVLGLIGGAIRDGVPFLVATAAARHRTGMARVRAAQAREAQR